MEANWKQIGQKYMNDFWYLSIRVYRYVNFKQHYNSSHISATAPYTLQTTIIQGVVLEE